MSSESRIRLLIAEDHFLARLAVETLISDHPDLELVARAETGWAAVALYQQHRPDAVIMDLRLPELDGIAATAAIVRADPSARVLVLSNSDAPEDVKQVMAAGATGYLRKDVDARTLIGAVRAVAAGQRYVQTEIAAQLQHEDQYAELTRRELDILGLVAAGRSNQQLADQLGISEGTVRVHMSNIMLKLGVKRRTEAVAVALRRGLVRLG